MISWIALGETAGHLGQRFVRGDAEADRNACAAGDMGCQFALPHRDPAFAIVEGRECCDPRPRAMIRMMSTRF